MLKTFWILATLAALAWGQNCPNPTFNWGQGCGARACEGCLEINFNNGRGSDRVCLRKGFGDSCTLTGNLDGDRSYIAVTSSTLSRRECVRSLQDLEVRHPLFFGNALSAIVQNLTEIIWHPNVLYWGKRKILCVMYHSFAFL